MPGEEAPGDPIDRLACETGPIRQADGGEEGDRRCLTEELPDRTGDLRAAHRIPFERGDQQMQAGLRLLACQHPGAQREEPAIVGSICSGKKGEEACGEVGGVFRASAGPFAQSDERPRFERKAKEHPGFHRAPVQPTPERSEISCEAAPAKNEERSAPQPQPAHPTGLRRPLPDRSLLPEHQEGRAQQMGRLGCHAMRRNRSLNNSFLALGTWLSSLALLLAIALGGSVFRLTVLAQEFGRSIASLRAVEKIEVNLLIAARGQDPFIETGEARWLQDWTDAEAEIGHWIEQARLRVETEEEREVARRLGQRIILIRQIFNAGNRSATRAEIGAALEEAEQLIALNERTAAAAVRHAEQWEQNRARRFRRNHPRHAREPHRALQLYPPLDLPARTSASRSAPAAGYRSGSHVPEDGPLELQEIAADVNGLVDRLAAQRTQQLTFMAAVAHDLRNPMTGLRATAQLMARQAESEKQRARAETMLRQVDRMNRLVEDLLDVSRVEAGQFDLHLETSDLRAVVREAFELFEDSSEIHELRCHLPQVEVPVHHDPARMSQVLGNLLSNAIKYSPAGGLVEMRLEVRDQRAVVVIDKGLGIPADEHEAIFEPFRRSGGARGEIPGVGLGLSVARRLVRAQGGEIEVESEPGQGSTFRVFLPLAS